MADKYEVYKDKSGEWRWRFVASNGNNMANGGEGYKNKSDCVNGIEKVKNSKDAPIEYLDE